MPDLCIYPYSLEPGVTRVAAIHSGMWDDPIRCHLDHVKIEAVTKEPYIALSYVWGSSKAVETVQINSQNHDIGINLACAIRHLRDEKCLVMIWIDAVCINQQNLLERSTQVAMMRDIYSRAQGVVVFLGEGSYYRIPTRYANLHPQAPVIFWNDSRDDAWLGRFRQSWEVLCKRRSWFSFCTICLVRLLSDLDHRQDALQCIVDGSDAGNQWWHRIWVVQEITVSPEVSVQYGNVTAPWHMFEQAAGACDRLGWGPDPDGTESFLGITGEHAKALPRFSRQVLEIKRLRLQWKESRGADLISLLQEFSGRLASDDRDKVFALLGLARENQLIKPDYSLDTLEVYHRTVVDLIRDTGSLSALTGDLRRKNSRGFPTWVPDWTAIFEGPDYRRMALQKVYSACSSWRMRFVESEQEYWEHILQGMQGLLDTLKSRKQRLVSEALLRYREHIQTLAYVPDLHDFNASSIDAKLSSVQMCLKQYEMVGINSKVEAYGDAWVKALRMLSWLKIEVRTALLNTPTTAERLETATIEYWSAIYVKDFLRTLWEKMKNQVLLEDCKLYGKGSKQQRVEAVRMVLKMSEKEYKDFRKKYDGFPAAELSASSRLAEQMEERLSKKLRGDAASRGLDVREDAFGVAVEAAAAEVAAEVGRFCFNRIHDLLSQISQAGTTESRTLLDIIRGLGLRLSAQLASRTAMSRIGQVCEGLVELNNYHSNTLRIKIFDLFKSSFVFGDRAAWMRCPRDPRVDLSLYEWRYSNIRKQHLDASSENTEILPTESRAMAAVNWCGPRLVTWIGATSRLLSVSQWVVMAQELCLYSANPYPLPFLRTLVGGIHEASPTELRRLGSQDYDHLQYWFVNSLLPALSAANPGVDKEAWKTTVASHRISEVEPGEQRKSFDKEMRLVTEGRVFFTTMDKRMGLGPSSMAEGDEINILPSGETPFVLRPRGKVDGCFEPAFEVIGDCFWTLSLRIRRTN